MKLYKAREPVVQNVVNMSSRDKTHMHKSVGMLLLFGWV